MKRAYRITVYNAKDGWRWRMQAPNHRIVAESGEAYTRRASAVRAAEALVLGCGAPRMCVVPT
jgi:uncharacterized protein YegP (UPF0339 family)